mgnify:CR=1 FL=1
MTANEFIERYAKLARSFESYVALGYSEKYTIGMYYHHFCNKRAEPFLLSYTYDDVLVDLVRDYEVENGYFEVITDVQLHAQCCLPEYDEYFRGYNAILIGSFRGGNLVINKQDGAIEIRYTETPDPESVLLGHGCRCAQNGESFLLACLFCNEEKEKLMFEDTKDYTDEEVERRVRTIAQKCTEIAGGDQFQVFWYFHIWRLRDF